MLIIDPNILFPHLLFCRKTSDQLIFNHDTTTNTKNNIMKGAIIKYNTLYRFTSCTNHCHFVLFITSSTILPPFLLWQSEFSAFFLNFCVNFADIQIHCVYRFFIISNNIYENIRDNTSCNISARNLSYSS